MLSEATIETFVRDGYVVVRDAVPSDIVDRCVATTAHELAGTGVDLADRATWVAPTARFTSPHGGGFEAAGVQAGLVASYDQLAGAGRWSNGRSGGCAVPVRFPHEDRPWDAAWHADGGFFADGDYWINVFCRRRALLVIILLSDVDERSAPTELKVGSHLDVARVLAPLGERGSRFLDLWGRLPSTTWERPSVFATGAAGDVYVCHPFLMHRASWPHRGTGPRVIVTPDVALDVPYGLDEPDPPPVVRAIVAATRQAARAS